MTLFTFLLVYILFAFGIWYVAGRARVSRAMREALYGDGSHPPRVWLVELIECPACLGYWIGSLLAVPLAGFALSTTPEGIVAWALWSFFAGCVTTTTNLVLFAATRTTLDYLDNPKE